MEQIRKFKAIDGKEFNDADECLDYERMINDVNSIMAELPAKPDGTDFSNGSGYIQHDQKKFLKVRTALLNYIKKYIDHKWIDQTIADVNCHPSYVARLVSDYNIVPLDRAWYRFYCTDKFFREWGQPYFTTHPEAATLKPLNNG